MSLYQDILKLFMRISNESIGFVDAWRRGKKDILIKINVNNQIDVVTELDYQIERNAKKNLNKHYPEFEFVGEEGFKGNFEIFDQNYFIIDPIDGTKAFVKGSKDWGISICAVIDGVPSIALLNIPDKHLLITGIKNEKVCLNGIPIEIKTTVNQKVAISPRQLTMVEKCFKKTSYVPQEMSALTPKVAAVMTGDVEAALYFPENGKSASIWDYAAACFLLEEAGGVMKSFDGNNLPYSGEGTIYRGGWIASRSDKTYSDIKKLVEIKL